MTTIRNITIVFALTASAALANAEGGSYTREQVKAELAEAIRTGDIISGQSSQKLNELYPNRYPPKPVVVGKTRAEVKAELAEAIRTGDIISGQTSQKLNELYPNRYPPKPVVVGKTRAEVKAELAEAVRTGEIIGNGETGMLWKELNPGYYAAHAHDRKPSSDPVTAKGEAPRSH